MRKQILAVLSILGIAGSSAPSQAQVLKGSKNTSTKAESTIKLDKAKQERNAAAAAAAQKDKKNASGVDAAKADANIKMNKSNVTTQKDVQIKGNKTAAEKTAVKTNATQKAIKTAPSPK